MNYRIMNKFHCIRIPADDARILEMSKPADFTFYIQYEWQPTKEEEEFQLKQRFQAYQWNDVFVIETPEEAEKKKKLS